MEPSLNYDISRINAQVQITRNILESLKRDAAILDDLSDHQSLELGYWIPRQLAAIKGRTAHAS